MSQHKLDDKNNWKFLVCYYCCHLFY